MFVILQGSEVLSQDGTLSIHAVSYDKAGAYMCVGAVPSVPGLTSHASVNLTIKGNTPDMYIKTNIYIYIFHFNQRHDHCFAPLFIRKVLLVPAPLSHSLFRNASD